jgi:hypothetical protein
VSTQGTQPLPAGWYPDPAGGQGQRWHDGQGWTGETSYAKPMKPLGAPFARLGDWLARLLLFNCLLNVVGLGVEIWAYTVPHVVAVANPAAPGTLPPYLLVTVLLGCAMVLAEAVTGVLWLVWQHRLAVSTPGVLRSSPAMHVVWWFVPFAYLWMPIRAMADLWRSYGTNRRNAAPVAGPPLFAWWVAWLLTWFFSGYIFVGAVAGTSSPQIQALAVYGAIGAIITAVAARLAAHVVRVMSWEALLVHADRP